MIKLIVLDIDGVMTDGKKYYDKDGTVRFKTFCDKDWTAIKRFRALGLQVVFLTGDPFNVSIAENRKIDIYVNRQNGVHSDKSNYLTELCATYNVIPDEIAFAGDDIFDLKLMRLVGRAYCPTDSPEIVQDVAIRLTKGGENFVMTMFDHMQKTNQLPAFDFLEHLERVYELDLQEKF